MFLCRRWVLVPSAKALHVLPWAGSARSAWCMVVVSHPPGTPTCTVLAFPRVRLELPRSGVNTSWVQTALPQPSSAASGSLRASACIVESCRCEGCVWPCGPGRWCDEGVCTRAGFWQPLLHSAAAGGEPRRPATQTTRAGLLKELPVVYSWSSLVLWLTLLWAGG